MVMNVISPLAGRVLDSIPFILKTHCSHGSDVDIEDNQTSSMRRGLLDNQYDKNSASAMQVI